MAHQHTHVTRTRRKARPKQGDLAKRIALLFAYFVLLLPLLLIFVDTGAPYRSAVAALRGNQPAPEYLTGKAVKIEDQGDRVIAGRSNPFQLVRVRLDSGKDAGKDTLIEFGGQVRITRDQLLAEGDSVVVSVLSAADGRTEYAIYDHFRVPLLAPMLVLFALFVILIAGLKGIGSLLGLLVSFTIIVQVIVPQLLLGRDALLVIGISSAAILVVSTYLAHGISVETTIALISTIGALILTIVFSFVGVALAHLAGVGDEETDTLRMGLTSAINLRGLLLGGIIIGTLGAMNDITTTQVAAMYEMAPDSREMSFWGYVGRGLRIGREHVASLVNTLALAYAGTSLALLVVFTLNVNQTPLWVTLNSETVFQEIVRTIAGTAGLIVAVPLSTLLAAVIARLKYGAPSANRTGPRPTPPTHV